MSACAGMEELLAERASGPIAADDEARVADHVAACAPCRALAEEYERVFGMVGLSGGVGGGAPDLNGAKPAAARAASHAPKAQPPGRGEGASLAPSTLRAWKQRRQRRVTILALGAGFAAAAAAAALVLAPVFFAARAPRVEPAAAVAAWDPEVDAALYASGEGEESSGDEVTAEEVALAAFDEAEAR